MGVRYKIQEDKYSLTLFTLLVFAYCVFIFPILNSHTNFMFTAVLRITHHETTRINV